MRFDRNDLVFGLLRGGGAVEKFIGFFSKSFLWMDIGLSYFFCPNNKSVGNYNFFLINVFVRQRFLD